MGERREGMGERRVGMGERRAVPPRGAPAYLLDEDHVVAVLLLTLHQLKDDVLALLLLLCHRALVGDSDGVGPRFLLHDRTPTRWR